MDVSQFHPNVLILDLINQASEKLFIANAIHITSIPDDDCKKAQAEWGKVIAALENICKVVESD